MKSPTIKDVAARAGVSSATVSHVVNNTRNVTEGIRNRVNSAIDELSYTPNAMARSFKTGRRNTIGFIAPDISNIFFATAIEEVEVELSKRGYNLIVVNTKENPIRELNHIRTLATGLVDGLIIASTLEDYQDIADILPQRFPHLLFDRGINNCSADQVLMSCATAMRQGVTDLIKSGHTRIGFISGMQRIKTTAERLAAYQLVLREYNIEPDPSLVRYTDSMAKSAKACAKELLDCDCTAIVAANIVLTMDTVNVVQQYHQNTGRMCHILGYSYEDWYSWLPNLKTMVQPTREAGSIAGKQILRRIENPDAPMREIILTSMYSKAPFSR